VPSSTENIDNDFLNGTFNNTEIYIIENDAVLRLNSLISKSNNWIEKKVQIKPDERYSHAMATIWGTDKVLLYGGANFTGGFKIYNDTWIYDYCENNWTEMSPSGIPGEIYFHAMASIYGTDKVLLFSPHSLQWHNTWIYDLSNNSWTEKAGLPSNSSLNGAAMASVFGTDKVVLFGTIGSTTQNIFNETWIFDLSNNTWTNKTPKDPTKSPPIRTDHAMASIYGTKKVLLHGGSFSNLSYWVRYNDTWIYDLLNDTWTRIFTPIFPYARERHAMATLNGTDKVLLYGGWDGWGPKNDTWIFDYSENAWINTTPTNNPGNLNSHAMAFVYGTTSAVLFGGILKTGPSSYNIFDETWIYDCILFKENGTYVSSPYEIGPNSSFKTLNWNASTSDQTVIEFQVRTAKSKLELASKQFIGNDGTTSSYYTVPYHEAWPGHEGDSWVQYKAYLKTNDIMDTPILRNVTIIFNRWPNTTLVYPPNDSILSNKKLKFNWNFTDFDSTNQTAFQLIISDNISFETIDYDSDIQNSKDFTWQFPFGTSYEDIPGGVWYWKVRTKDNDGDWGFYSEPWRFAIDTNAPESIITNPLDNRFYNNLSTVSGIAYDSIDGIGLNRIEITIKSVSGNSYWTGSKWVLSETWLSTSGTIKWFYDLSSVILYSGYKYNIRSRAIDNAHNIEIPNKGITFIIDLDNVTFSNHFPPFKEESPYEDVTVCISISDKVSGVNASTIEYSTSKDEGKTWTSWEPVTGLKSGKTVNITLNLTFPNGTENRIKWRASDIAGNGPTESKTYTIKINTGLQRFIPRVRLWSPPDGAVVPTTSVKLNWLLENTNLLGASYDLYFDTSPPTKPNITGLVDLSFKLNDLIDGETYYWMVIPKVDSEEGLCTSGIWSFTIDTSVVYPTVKLLRPQNGSIVSSTKPTFAWAVDYYGTETLSYHVYLDSRPELINYEESYNRYYLPSTLLQENLTYYWKVVPKAGNIVGPESETWSFTVRKGYVPHFELELKVEPLAIVMEPASIKMVKAFVTNKGELTDRISLSINVPFDSDMGGMMNEPNIQEAEPGETANFSFILTTTQNIDASEVIITVTATSGEALDFGIDYEEELKVKVIIFVEEEAKPERFSEWLFFWGILIIIIVTILALLILILFGRKKQEQETLPEDKTDILKLLETPTIEQTQETLPEKDTATPKTLDVTTPKPVQENLQEEQHEPDQPTISHEEQKEGEEEICE
jgi:hypothetical protein